MEKNVGPVDAKLRMGVGLVLIALAAVVTLGDVGAPLVGAVVLATTGAVLFLEGALSRCLLYRLLGIDRCPVD